MLLHVSIALLSATAIPSQSRDGYVERSAGVRLYYRVEGTGPDTLVFLHGGPGGILTEREVGAEAPLFARHTVVFYQQRGTGKSSAVGDDSLLTAAQHVEDLDALRRTLRLQRLSLYGHSWGGGLAALYAVTYPDRVAKLILLNPMPPRLNGIGQDVPRLRLSAEQRAQWVVAARRYEETPDTTTCLTFQRLNVIISTVPGPNRDSLVVEACRDPHPPTALEQDERRREEMVYRVAIGSWRSSELLEGLRTVTVPVLLLQGDADFVPFSGLLDYARGFPNARYRSILNAGHDLPADNPVPVFAAIEAFLAGTWPADAREGR